MRELCERALDRHEEDEDPANGIEDERLGIETRRLAAFGDDFHASGYPRKRVHLEVR